MKRFEPFRTYSSPSRRASLRIAAESEPEPGSVSAYAASHSPLASRGSQRSFCSSVPASLIPSEPSSWTARISPVVAQTFESSSIATSTISAPVPVPSCCSSNGNQSTSCSRISSTMSQVNSADLSISAARGATRSRARSRTRSRISRCSAVKGSLGTAGSLVPVVADGLDVVAVGVKDEGAVVARVVVALARGAIVAEAGCERDAVELVDGRVVGRREGDVQVLGQRLAVLRDREIGPLREPLLGIFPTELVAERREHGRVEHLRRGEVRDANRDVVDHAWPLYSKSLS